MYLDTYPVGASLDQVQALTGASRGTISNYLHELERQTGVSILRQPRPTVNSDALPENSENGQRRASLRDFHSFRVT